MKIIKAVISVLLCAVMLSSCALIPSQSSIPDPAITSPGSSSQSVSPDSSSSSQSSSQPEEDESLTELKAKIKDADAMCAVAFLGYCESKDFTEVRTEVLDNLGYTEAYPFTADITESEFIVIGPDTYAFLIVPADSSYTVSVNSSADGVNYDKDEYRSETAKPILVLCDALMSLNAEVVVTDSQRNSVFYPAFDPYVWAPILPNSGTYIDITMPNGAGNSNEQEMADVLFLHVEEIQEQISQGKTGEFSDDYVEIADNVCRIFKLGTYTDTEDGELFITDEYYAVNMEATRAYKMDFLTGEWSLIWEKE